MKRLLLIFALLGVLFVSTAAAKGSPNYTISVSPANPTRGSTVTITSCGYRQNQTVALVLWFPFPTGEFAENLRPDLDGCVSAQFKTASDPNDPYSVGTYRAQAWLQNANGYYSNKPVAETTFEVVV